MPGKKPAKKAVKKSVKRRNPKKRLDCNGDPILLSEARRSRRGKSGQLPWAAPKDMPDQMVKQVLAGKMCGARKKHVKEGCCLYCQSRKTNLNPERMPPYRCKMHGGMSIGPPTGSQNAKKHGAFSFLLETKEDEEMYEAFEKGDRLKPVIAMTMVRLVRAVTAQHAVKKKLEEGEDLSDELVMVEHEKQTGYGENTGTYDRKKKKIPDYGRIIHDIINQLIKLEQTQFNITGGSEGHTPEDKAKMARRFLAEAEEQAGI